MLKVKYAWGFKSKVTGELNDEYFSSRQVARENKSVFGRDDLKVVRVEVSIREVK